MKRLLLTILLLLSTPSFAMAAPTVTVTSPNGGEALTVGSVARITWNSTDVDKVTIFYQPISGSSDYIANSIVNTGYYDWTVNVGSNTSTQFKIWILAYQTGVGQANDYSDNYFTVNKIDAPVTNTSASIEPLPTINLSTNATEVTPGSTAVITWSSTNATSCTASNAWAGDKATSGSQTLNILKASNVYTLWCTGGGGTVSKSVTVTLVAPTTVSTASTGATPTVSIVSPISDDVWLPGNTYGIKWNQQGISNITRVNLVRGGSEIVYTFVENLPTTLDSQIREASFTVPPNLILQTGSSLHPTQHILESNLYSIQISAFSDQVRSYSGATFAIKKPSTTFSSTLSSGIPTPYLLNIDSITDTSISPRLEVAPNGTENARVRFQISLKNGTSIFKTAIVPLPPVNTRYSASTTITGLSPNTDYVLITQAETDQIIFYPQFGRISNFTTKPASSASQVTSPANTSTVVAVPVSTLPTISSISPSNAVQLYLRSSLSQTNTTVNIPTTGTVSGCTSTSGFSSTTGKSCVTGNTTTSQPVVTQPISISGTDIDTSEQSSCVDLSNNLRYRMRDSSVDNEVSDLQDFLNVKGFLSSEPTGFFGLATLRSVKAYQSSVGISPTGFVGPLTRAKINATGCLNRGINI